MSYAKGKNFNVVFLPLRYSAGDTYRGSGLVFFEMQFMFCKPYQMNPSVLNFRLLRYFILWKINSECPTFIAYSDLDVVLQGSKIFWYIFQITFHNKRVSAYLRENNVLSTGLGFY